MNRVLTAAAFIKNNMPYLQASWEKPKLSDEEAFHVAGYINSFPRPSKKIKKWIIQIKIETYINPLWTVVR